MTPTDNGDTMENIVRRATHRTASGRCHRRKRAGAIVLAIGCAVPADAGQDPWTDVRSLAASARLAMTTRTGSELDGRFVLPANEKMVLTTKSGSQPSRGGIQPDQAGAGRAPLWGYAFGGAGAYERRHQIDRVGEVTEHGHMPMFGAAVEWRSTRFLGLSAEGAVADYDGHPQPLFSLNASGSLRDRAAADTQLSPFVTGGYSLIADLEPKLNVGAGVDYRLRRTIGLRASLHHYFALGRNRPSGTLTSYTAVRAGLSVALSRSQ